jgi:hypothetical protein
VFVDADAAINTAVRKVRRALADDPDMPRFLETVVGKGYRFVGPVAVIPVAEATPRSVSIRGRWHGRPVLLTVALPAAGRFGLAAAGHGIGRCPAWRTRARPETEYLSDGITESLINRLTAASAG